MDLHLQSQVGQLTLKEFVVPEKNGSVYLPIPPIITNVSGGRIITA